MTPAEQRAGAAIRRLGGDRRMVELGFGSGKMASALLRLDRMLRLWTVDNFLPAEKQPERYKNTRDNFSQCSAERMAGHEGLARGFDEAYGGRFNIIKSDTVEAARMFDDGSVDLVFVDADHSYEGVKRDIAAWIPKVRRGGWIGGHDYGNPDERFDFSGVDIAVNEFWRNFGKQVEFDANFTWWCRL